MNAPQTYDAGFSHQIGRYPDAIRVPAGYDQIVVSGTPGLDENGNIPADFADEARQVWRNVAAILEKAGASISDIVSVRQYLTREEDIKNGNIPADFADEARQVWRNVAAILEKAGASISDIVSVRQYLTREEDIKTYVEVRNEMVTHEPAGMLLVAKAMAWPAIRVEVEAVALVPSGR